MIGKVTSFDEKYNTYGGEREFTLQVDIKGESAVELLSKLFDQDRQARGSVRIDTLDGLTYAWKILDDNVEKVSMPQKTNIDWSKWFNIIRKRCFCEPKSKVIFNEPATILYKDGKKYVCKCDKHDSFNEELGLALCLLKSFGVTYSDFRKLLDNAKRQGVKNEE